MFGAWPEIEDIVQARQIIGRIDHQLDEVEKTLKGVEGLIGKIPATYREKFVGWLKGRFKDILMLVEEGSDA